MADDGDYIIPRHPDSPPREDRLTYVSRAGFDPPAQLLPAQSVEWIGVDLGAVGGDFIAKVEWPAEDSPPAR